MTRRGHQRTPAVESTSTAPVFHERVLPHDLDAERSVLGALLIANDHYDLTRAVLRPDDFFRRAHQYLFAAVGVLIDAGTPADLITLKDSLERQGLLGECGGVAYISRLTDGVPRSTNVTYYARIVREHALRRQVIRLATVAIGEAYEASRPAADLLNAIDRQVVEAQTSRVEGHLTPLGESALELYAYIEDRQQRRGAITGISSGTTGIDDLTNGWQAGDVILLAARTSIGKTAAALQFAMAAAETGKSVAIFSLEMPRVQLQVRMLAHLSGVMLSKIQRGYMTDADFEAVALAYTRLSNLPIAISDLPGQTVWDIRSSARRMRSEGGVDLLVIDYVQLIEGSQDAQWESDNRAQQLTVISRNMKRLARELKVPILALAQLNRDAAKRRDPRPVLSDLKESSSLEQDADIVMFLHRTNHREGGLTECIVDKQRQGPTGTVNLYFDRDTQRFREATLEEARARKESASSDTDKRRPQRALEYTNDD